MAGSIAEPLPRFDRDGGRAASSDEATIELPDGAPPDANDALDRLPPGPSWLGPLLRAAWPTLTVLNRLGCGFVTEDPGRLKASVIELVRRFERQAAKGSVADGHVLAARYMLCTALDEAVLLTAWGRESGWNAPSLLSLFHGETWGGETMFVILERAMADPGPNRELLELGHLLMLTGFQGRFRRERDGTAAADALRERLFVALFRDQPARTLTLAPPPMPGLRQRRVLLQYLPVWVVAAFCAGLLMLGAFGLAVVLSAAAGDTARHFVATDRAVGAATPSGGTASP